MAIAAEGYWTPPFICAHKKRPYHPSVYYFFDESGDFAFPDDRFDSYVQAALICPDSQLDEVERFVRQQRADWGVDELHATDLSAAQLLLIADFLHECPCHLLAHVTDTVLVTAKEIAQFRIDQAATPSRDLEWYRTESTKAIGAPVPEIEKRIAREIKRSGLEAQMNHCEFVQARFLIELIFDAVQKSLLVYFEDRWRNDFDKFHFVLDGKLPTKLAAGEKYLNDVIVPALGSRPAESLTLAETWRHEPHHPFVARYCRDRGRIRGREATGVTNLSGIVERGLRFELSHAHGGLQLVDSVAHIVRRVVLEPDNPDIQAAYDALRTSLRTGRPSSLTIQRLPRGSHGALVAFDECGELPESKMRVAKLDMSMTMWPGDPHVRIAHPADEVDEPPRSSVVVPAAGGNRGIVPLRAHHPRPAQLWVPRAATA